MKKIYNKEFFMRLIGVTGKSGSGKSYFSNLLGVALKKSKVVNFDNIFSNVMNNEDIVAQVYAIYGDEAIKDGKIDLDSILINKEMFNTIFTMVIQEVEERVKQDIEQSEVER